MDCRKGEYAERRAKGICVMCGRRQPTIKPDGSKMSTCEVCRERHNRYRRNMRARKAGKLAKRVEIEKSVSCKSCQVRINESYYFCPWCGAKQNPTGGEKECLKI